MLERKSINMQVNIREAKNRLSELIKSAQAGDDVVIGNRGQPVVRLVPTQSNTKIKQNRNLLVWLQSNPLPKHAQKSAAEIDAGIQFERRAWDC
jgi:prevent-host-death family protein